MNQEMMRSLTGFNVQQKVQIGTVRGVPGRGNLFSNSRQDKGQKRGTSAMVIKKIKTVRRAPTFRKSANR